MKYTAILILLLLTVACGCKRNSGANTTPEHNSPKAAIVESPIKAEKTPKAETITSPVEKQILQSAIPKVKELADMPEKPKPIADDDNAKPVEDASKNESPKNDSKQSNSILAKMEFFKNCDFVFKNYVDKNGKVDYLKLRRKKLELLAAVRELGNIPTEMRLSWSEEDEKAFLLNAHNILMIKLIIDNYPIKPNKWASIFYPTSSIKQIPGAREKNFYRVAGFRYTIIEIEEELLKTSNDPRYCFALSNSTVSGGLLRNEAYHPDKLDKQLDEQAWKYLADPKNFRISNNEKKIHLSSIFKLKNFKESFLRSKYATIKRFREKNPELQAFLNFIFLNIDRKKADDIERMGYDVEFETYNWLLNEQGLK